MNKELNVLQNTELVTLEDFEFLKDHKENFEKRLKTRSLFRSKFEMEASVLNSSIHPTSDSQFWQACGEQIVQLQELISLSFENAKHAADKDLMEAEIEELEEELEHINKGYEKKKILAKIKKKKIEVEQNKFGDILQKKTAKERMREIIDWEEIIKKLEPTLKYGNEDFALHHPERYLKRYKLKMENLDMIDMEAKENVISHFKSFSEHPDNKNLIKSMIKPKPLDSNKQRILPENGHKVLNRPDGNDSCSKEYKNEDEMLENEKVVSEFFKRETNKILVGTPHRLKEDINSSNLNLLQIPAGMSALAEAPYGFSVADARNFIVEKAIDYDFEYVFFLDDDLIIPRNTIVTLINYIKNGYDVASGFYYRKYFPLESCSMMEDKKGRPDRVDFKIGDIFENILVLCSGCTLFKTEVFKRIEKPWYKEIYVNGKVQVTEDTYMCQQIRNSEISNKTILDTGIQCIHVNKDTGVLYGHTDIIQNNAIIEKYRSEYTI